ncbi:MAG: hypothetical protein RMJ67_01090 [Elusimicrobiota bacterium]|nr:hypothetical protein [Endomicrobiia bacterium]MDW8165098.1 hypothetical protein [Elusimicrobiota bacterium]
MVILSRFYGTLKQGGRTERDIDIYSYNENLRQFVIRVMTTANLEVIVDLKRNNTTIYTLTTDRISDRPNTVLYFVNTGDWNIISITLKNTSTSENKYHLILEAYEN